MKLGHWDFQSHVLRLCCSPFSFHFRQSAFQKALMLMSGQMWWPRFNFVEWSALNVMQVHPIFRSCYFLSTTSCRIDPGSRSRDCRNPNPRTGNFRDFGIPMPFHTEPFLRLRSWLHMQTNKETGNIYHFSFVPIFFLYAMLFSQKPALLCKHGLHLTSFSTVSDSESWSCPLGYSANRWYHSMTCDSHRTTAEFRGSGSEDVGCRVGPRLLPST